MALRIDGDVLELPALATAHSHAFQRAMRGKAQRRSATPGDFWSWRSRMYELAASLTPESIHNISRVAFDELRARGVRTVGEFHYVHHQADGTPYASRTELAERVIAAARDAGLRIALLRVVYERAGAGKPPEGSQRRFCDAELDDALADVDALVAHHRDDPDVVIGIAPHSVRAVSPPWLARIDSFARERDLPIHMHVAEQPAEIEACLAESGKRPVELLDHLGLLSKRFVAVHATHLGAGEAALLGSAGAGVCLCPTTERDLGDGLPDVAALVRGGVALSVGIDSHVVCAPLEELRAIELGERTRTLGRAVLDPPPGHSPASWLWEIGSHGSARAVGFDDAGGTIAVRRDHPDLRYADEDELLDALVFSAASDAIDRA